MSKIHKVPHLSMLDEITAQFQRQSLIPILAKFSNTILLHTIPICVTVLVHS